MCRTSPSLQKNSQTIDKHAAIAAMLRQFTMLKKAVLRLVRRTYRARSKYPECVRQFEQRCARLHAWLRTYAHFWGFPIFQRLLAEFLQSLHNQYAQVLSLCVPEAEATGKTGKTGKKGTGSRRHETHRELCRRIDAILQKLEGRIDTSTSSEGQVAGAFEEALRMAFASMTERPPARPAGSQRGMQTVVFPYPDPREYATWTRTGRV